MTGPMMRGGPEATSGEPPVAGGPIELPGPEVRMARMVFPDQTNHMGTLFGGQALSMMDEACFVAASRLARKTCVTVSVDRIDFTVPVHAGELVEVVARVVAVGRTSLTCQVELYAEDLLSGDRRRATSGKFVLVAVDRLGRPTPVVPEAETAVRRVRSGAPPASRRACRASPASARRRRPR